MIISELESILIKHAETTKSIMQPPFDLKEEIKKMEVHTMSKPKITIKKALVIAAILALCIATIAITPLANSIRGFFRDIVRFDGAVIGTKYENATNDIKVDILELASKNNNTIPLELTFEYPTKAPFPYIQEIAVSEYKILDSNNNEIIKTKLSAEKGYKGTISNGKASVNLKIDGTKLKSGQEYTIIIEKMYGLAKADAPLHITGTWKCNFTK